jgi:hypothetical protein
MTYYPSRNGLGCDAPDQTLAMITTPNEKKRGTKRTGRDRMPLPPDCDEKTPSMHPSGAVRLRWLLTVFRLGEGSLVVGVRLFGKFKGLKSARWVIPIVGYQKDDRAELIRVSEGRRVERELSLFAAAEAFRRRPRRARTRWKMRCRW